MRISDILKTNKVTVSCEMFPPKPGKPLENTQQVVHEIAAYKPSFMSVTYGAGGSNSKNTLSIAEEVQKSGVTALAHLTCVGQDEENLRASINAFKASGIENILALRGDIPEGDTAPQTFPHASDLINAHSPARVRISASAAHVTRRDTRNRTTATRTLTACAARWKAAASFSRRRCSLTTTFFIIICSSSCATIFACRSLRALCR